ncbi:MAG: hypothetical protein ACK5Q7_08270 [Cyanobacteriota bacterium]|jgi:hypothetical protein
MKSSKFRITSKQSAESFEEGLKHYCSANNIYFHPLGLSRAFEILAIPAFDNRCFAAYLDLFLQDVVLQLDIQIICAKTNEENKDQREDGFSEIRMDRYIAASNAVHRIRSMLDKIMGLIILLECPDKYQKFDSSNSRKKEFNRIHSNWIDEVELEESDLRSSLMKDLERIEKAVDSICYIRTSEAHSIGILSKFAFAKQRDEEDPFEVIIESYNEVRHHMSGIISKFLMKAHYRSVS